MGKWTAVNRVSMDEKLTNEQSNRIKTLQEMIDQRPRGSYAANDYTMTKAEASRYITMLEDKLAKRSNRFR